MDARQPRTEPHKQEAGYLKQRSRDYSALQDAKGKPDQFELWRMKIVGHCSAYTSRWGDLLDYCRKRAFPSREDELNPIMSGEEDPWSLPKELGNSISNHMSIDIYKRRTQFASTEGNGFRMWQRLRDDSGGGDLFTDIDGCETFQCNRSTNADDLGGQLDDRRSCQARMPLTLDGRRNAPCC